MTGSPSPHLRRSTRSDLAAVKTLLSASVLPTEDLESATDLRFWVAEDGASIIGTIGLESYGAAGLLRSLAVAPAYRGRGIGIALVTRLEEEARDGGMQLLVLLTETAQPFFGRFGYHVIERAYVPVEIMRSTEFSSLCPASAICMMKTLSEELQRG